MKNKLVLGSLIILLGCISCKTSQERNSHNEGQSIEIKEKSHRQGIDLFVLIDNSGSMIGNNGTDPNGIRRDASKYLLQNLFVKKSDEEYPNRVSIIQFADKAVATPLMDVLPGNLSTIENNIHQANLGLGVNTNFLVALQEVKNVLANSKSYKNLRERAIVIFTDGKPEKANNESAEMVESYFGEIQQFMKELGDYKIYLIGIDNPDATVKFSQTVNKWKSFLFEDNISFLHDIKELYSSFNKVVESILEIKSSETFLKSSGEFDVNPYVDDLEFHVFTSRPISLTIKDPKGKVLNLGSDKPNSNGYIIHKVQNPVPGKWVYNLRRSPSDNEPIRIVKNEIPFRLELLTPEPIFNSLGQRYFPLGKKVRLKAQFTKENGQEIEEISDFPLAFSARINSVDNPVFDKQLRFLPQNKAGLNYYSDEYLVFDKEGKYNIHLNVKGGNKVEFSQTEKIEIVKIPYFELIETLPLTQINPGDNIVLNGKLKIGNENINPAKFFMDDPNSAILAQVIKSPDNQQKSIALWMEQSIEDKSTLFVMFPAKRDTFNTNKEGIYEVALDFKVKPIIEYKLFPNRVTSSFDIVVKKSFTYIFFGYLWWFVLGVTFLLLAGALYKLYKFKIDGLSYQPRGLTVIAIVEKPEESEKQDDGISNSQLEESNKCFIIDGERSINKYSNIVKLEIGKSKKGKKVFTKIWARPLDLEGLKIEIYMGGFLRNLLLWKKPIVIFDDNINAKTIKVKSYTIELIMEKPISDSFDINYKLDEGLENSEGESDATFKL